MSKKGFTLVELLAVIVMLGIIALIAVPAIMGITGAVKNNMYEKKLEMIEESGVLYGESIRKSIINSSRRYNNYPCINVKVSDLVPKYLDKDNNNECGSETAGCIVDPNDDSKFLDNVNVVIYYKNKRINAVANPENNCS